MTTPPPAAADQYPEPPCWCGEQQPYYEPLGRCGGDGTFRCICGGDFCVCHNHGEVECFGCEDCDDEPYEDEYVDDYDR